MLHVEGKIRPANDVPRGGGAREQPMAEYYVGHAGEAPSLADESTRGEMEELLILLEEKDADLRRAAELGKGTNVPSEHRPEVLAHQETKKRLWMDARPSAAERALLASGDLCLLAELVCNPSRHCDGRVVA